MTHNWASDPDVTRCLAWSPHESIDVTHKQIESLISKYDELHFYQWAIVLKVGANRIEASHAIENPYSGKVLVKCGLKYEGTHRQAVKTPHGLCDELHYAILAEDYFSNMIT